MPDDSDAADKSTLRAIARQRRRNFVASLDALTHRLAFKAVPSPLAQRIADAQVIALYMALDDEAPAQRLAPQLGVMGKQVALPRVLDRLGSGRAGKEGSDHIVQGLRGAMVRGGHHLVRAVQQQHRAAVDRCQDRRAPWSAAHCQREIMDIMDQQPRLLRPVASRGCATQTQT